MTTGYSRIDLHIHPFLRQGGNSLEDVLHVMRRGGPDVVAFQAYTRGLFKETIAQARRAVKPHIRFIDGCGITFSDGVTLFSGREYSCSEGFHILVVGHELPDAGESLSIDEIMRRADDLAVRPIIIIAHPYVDIAATGFAGDISPSQESRLADICLRHQGNIALEWNGYCTPWIRAGLKIALKARGHDVRYHDVNRKAKALSESLQASGNNVPLVAGTDLHARDRFLLNAMGRASISTYLTADSPSGRLSELRANIFSGSYLNSFRYASSLHIITGYLTKYLASYISRNSEKGE